MKKVIYYTYLGDKGVLTTQLQIPGATSVKKVMLAADEGKKLTKDGKHFTSLILVPETEVTLWYEIDA
jgi:hypothetical protein